MENIHRLLTDDEKKLAIKKEAEAGRPSTRADIIEKLINHERIIMNKNQSISSYTQTLVLKWFENSEEMIFFRLSFLQDWKSKTSRC